MVYLIIFTAIALFLALVAYSCVVVGADYDKKFEDAIRKKKFDDSKKQIEVRQ
jgi:hypothetical protein